MKTVYSTPFILLTLFFFGCSKDFLKSYDRRIVGNWQITDVDRAGFGGSTDNLPFKNGQCKLRRYFLQNRTAHNTLLGAMPSVGLHGFQKEVKPFSPGNCTTTNDVLVQQTT